MAIVAADPLMNPAIEGPDIKSIINPNRKSPEFFYF